MIKVGKSLIELDALADIFYKEVLSKLDLLNKVSQNLNNARALNLNSEENFYNALLQNLKEIIVGKPLKLESLSKILHPLYSVLESFRVSSLPQPSTKKQRSLAKKDFRNEVYELFNYNSFTNDNGGVWAYKHSLRIGLNVCPYCNTHYTFTIKTSRGKTRPQFDHFIKKSKHPYFAISFYNLIPSCYVCNANLKGSKEFKPSTHIHPFVEGIEDTLHFKTNINKVDFLLGKKDFKIKLQKISAAKSPKVSRAKRSSLVFQIDEQYKYHKEYAGEIIYKTYLYTDSKIKELINEFHGLNNLKLFSSKEEITEMLFGNYLREDKLHERVLAKLTKNIANEMGVKV